MARIKSFLRGWGLPAALGLVLFGTWAAAQAGRTSGAEAKALVEKGALLLDVRTPEEFAEGHLPDAKNVPVQVLEQRLSELGAKERPIVVYCRSGARSGRATRMLTNAGFTHVHDLGPMDAWNGK